MVVTLFFLLSEVVVNESEITFGLHTIVDLFSQKLFVLVFQLVDLVPSVGLDVFSLHFMSLHHVLDLLFQPVRLRDLPI